MLMFIEFVLTIIAWRRGWRAWACIPALIPMTIECARTAVASSESAVQVLAGMEFVLQAGCVMALTVMAICGAAHRPANAGSMVSE